MNETNNQVPLSGQMQPNQSTFSKETVLNQKAVLPSNFLKSRWKQSFREKFGPLNPGVIIVSLILLTLFTIFTLLSYGNWVFQNSELRLLCPLSLLLALLGFLVAGLNSDESKKPISKISSRPRFMSPQMMRVLIGIFLLAAVIPPLMIGATIAYPESFFAVMGFEAIGMTIAMCIMGFTTQVHICKSCVNGPTNFRKIKGQWVCLACGTPKDR